ncbi:hypothetical protein GQF42_17980 [Streptomyces broussonetiae]|uniref:Uncharacterized protein n=1 Tax=Streptomyces broussonetiae TaxID=2686304 RepID=A0A6I6N938_9ACTN|nr:hypothetical protein GQF42_17980 [Streptomyces broussonetiae]
MAVGDLRDGRVGQDATRCAWHACTPPTAPPWPSRSYELSPFMSFLTLVTVAVVPLAAALYVVTSTAWTAVERAALYR